MEEDLLCKNLIQKGFLFRAEGPDIYLPLKTFWALEWDWNVVLYLVQVV